MGEEKTIRKTRQAFARRLEVLANVLSEMRAAGLPKPPKMLEEWTETMQKLGIAEGD